MHAAEVAHSFGGVAASKALVLERRDADFDPLLVETLVATQDDAELWRVLEQESVQRNVLDIGPVSSARRITDEEIDTICEALGDFTDIKTRLTWNYSPTVARLAVDIGRRMGMRQSQLTELRRAGLVHDLGKVGVPCAILLKEPELSDGEWERLRLHPYYAERVLDRVAQLKALASTVGAHHERFDGKGYHRQLSGAQIPLAARILGLAQGYALALRRLGEEASSDRALSHLRETVGSEVDPDCFEALSGVEPNRASVATRAASDARAERLTSREIEVLQQVASGLGNRQIAQALVISEKTVESHLEHVFDKLGVSTRTAAVVFAVHNGLIA